MLSPTVLAPRVKQPMLVLAGPDPNVKVSTFRRFDDPRITAKFGDWRDWRCATGTCTQVECCTVRLPGLLRATMDAAWSPWTAGYWQSLAAAADIIWTSARYYLVDSDPAPSDIVADNRQQHKLPVGWNYQPGWTR